jgi:hypothetical protein
MRDAKAMRELLQTHSDRRFLITGAPGRAGSAVASAC